MKSIIRLMQEYEVSLTLKVHTSEGEDMAKRIFSNMVKGDPNQPLRFLKVRALKEPVAALTFNTCTDSTEHKYSAPVIGYETDDVPSYQFAVVSCSACGDIKAKSL